MLRLTNQAFISAAILGFALTAYADSSQTLFDWDSLPALPSGFHQAVVGTDNGVLIVAAGWESSAPGSAPHGGAYVLPPGAAEWRQAATLPIAAGAGAFVSAGDGLIGIGGKANVTADSAWRVDWTGDTATVGPLPSLPEPISHAGAALLADTIYLVGGRDANGQLRATLLALDLAKTESGWRELEPLPGQPRCDAAVVALNGAIYVCGGAGVSSEPLSDCFRYTPAQGWSSIASLPASGALGPAIPYGQSHILFFADEIHAYHTITDTWTHYGPTPEIGTGRQVTLLNGQPVLLCTGAEGTRVYAGKPRPRTGAFTALDYATLVFYFGILLGAGFYFARREHSTDDFFLGGRRVPWWAVGLSIFGTSLSAITYLAIPAKAFATDWVFILSNLGILFVAPFVVRFYLPRFREAPITTAYEYLETRFNFAIRIYGSLVFLCFQIGRLAIVLFLPAIALSAATGLNIYACILVMGVLTTIYTMMGGIEAVIWTDVLQSFVLVAGAIAVVAVVAWDVSGGLSGIALAGWEAGKFHTFNWTWDATTTAVWVCIVGNAFGMAYPSTADQTVVQRYLSTATERDAAKAIWTNALLTIPVAILFFGIGTALWVFYRGHPEMLDPRIKTDAILPLFVAEQFPQGLSGLLIAGVFAAAMSSLDSSINSLSSVMVNDFYRRFRPGITDRHGLRVARGLTVFFGALATALALVIAQINAPSLFDQWLQILGLVGGGLAGIMALGVFTKRGNGTGAVLGALASMAIVYSVYKLTDIHFFLHGAIGFCSSFAIGYLASIVRPAPHSAYDRQRTGQHENADERSRQHKT